MITKRSLLRGVLITALAQSAVLVWMVYDRIQLLQNGREIVLPVIPVDPRSIFRGDYVRLAYPISRVPTRLLNDRVLRSNGPFFVTFKKDKKGDWSAISLRTFFEPPQDQNHMVLQGRPRPRDPWRSRRIRMQSDVVIRYGIERYFVPEGQGRVLEDLVRTKKLSVLISVDTNGRAAIKGLLVDNNLRYEEPVL